MKQLVPATNKAVAISRLLKIVTDNNHRRVLRAIVFCILATFSKVDCSEWNMLFTWYASKRLLVHSSNIQYGILMCWEIQFYYLFLQATSGAAINSRCCSCIEHFLEYTHYILIVAISALNIIRIRLFHTTGSKWVHFSVVEKRCLSLVDFLKHVNCFKCFRIEGCMRSL